MYVGTNNISELVLLTSGGAIVNREDSNCLHVDGNGDFPEDYTNVITSGCNDGNNQKWAFNGAGQLIHTPSGMCLDMGMYGITVVYTVRPGYKVYCFV